jgi:hypothetical protein
MDNVISHGTSELAQFGSVQAGPRLWLRCEGAVVFILSILLYWHTGAPWWRFAALLLVPDLAMVGYWAGARWGAVGYNVAHSYVWPALVAGLGLVSPQLAWLMPFALIWTAHIGMDRAAGYGLKYPGGFKQTHLGVLGRGGAD